MANAKKQPTGDYETGYCRPPTETQFRKGVSGNPKGRPKGAKNSGTMLQQIANEFVTVREGDRTRRMSQAEVMTRKLMNKAMSGDAKATDIVMRQLAKNEEREAAGAAVFSPVLIVPAKLDPDEWERAVAEQQAKYAGNTGASRSDRD